jgi:hypothetical protein
MAKPFKSEFDLMAEAYATVNYNKQQLINEDKVDRDEEAEDTIWDMEIYIKDKNGDAVDEPIQVRARNNKEGVEFASEKLGRRLKDKDIIDIRFPEDGFSNGVDGNDNPREEDHGFSNEDPDTEARRVKEYDWNDEAGESAENSIHARLDGMIDEDLLLAAQFALQQVLDDLHRHGEDFNGEEVGGFVGFPLG